VTDLRRALDRTLLLMREAVHIDSDAPLMGALTSTEIALAADAETLASPAAQTAFVTTAMLCARSGHKVHLVADNVGILGPQPPLRFGNLIDALLEADGRLVPMRRFAQGTPSHPVDLEIRLGATIPVCEARSRLAMTATDWSALIANADRPRAWPHGLAWPMGAMACADLAAAEAFKCAMRKLVAFARAPATFAEFFAPLKDVSFELAPEGTPTVNSLGTFDLISGGAITNGTLYALSRLPGVSGAGRIIEPDKFDVGNLNRYMMALIDDLGQGKAERLAALSLGDLSLSPLPWRFENLKSVGFLAPRVLVGVDHIPTRWAVQQARPRWLGIGATTHWSAMATHHALGAPCAGCAHPHDDDADGPIPTAACISFMAALLQTTDFLRDLAGASGAEQLTYLTVPRADKVWRAPVAFHTSCPVGHGAKKTGKGCLSNHCFTPKPPSRAHILAHTISFAWGQKRPFAAVFEPGNDWTSAAKHASIGVLWRPGIVFRAYPSEGRIRRPWTRRCRMATKSNKPATSKSGALLKALRSKNGASLEQLMEVSGWQAHSIRGFLAGTVKKRLSLKVESKISTAGERRYRILAS
jgi:hypothetical protein